MPSFPPLRVTFDDGTELLLDPRPRDMALAERDFGTDFRTEGLFSTSYALALAVLTRMKRAGAIDLELPATADALMDIADVEAIPSEDPEGKEPDPVATTG